MVGAIYIYTFDQAYQKALKQYLQQNHQSMISIHFIQEIESYALNTERDMPLLLLTDVVLDELPSGFSHMLFLSDEPTVSNRSLYKYQSFSELMSQALSYVGYQKVVRREGQSCQVIVVSSFTGGAGKSTLIKLAQESAVSGNSELVLQLMGGEPHPLGLDLSDFLWSMKKETHQMESTKPESGERPIFHFKDTSNGNSLPGFTAIEDYRHLKGDALLESLKQYAAIWGMERIWIECASAVDSLTEQLVKGSDVHLLMDDLSRSQGLLDVNQLQVLWGINSPQTHVVYTLTKKTEADPTKVVLPYDGSKDMLTYRGALKNFLYKIRVMSW